MIKRFSASLARKETDLAEQIARDNIKKAQEQRIQKAKRKKFLISGWNKQKKIILKAAMDGNKEISLISLSKLSRVMSL